MRKLTSQEIQKLASRKGVKAIAVENFLGSLDEKLSYSYQYANMRADASAYKWNAATVRAIEAGLTLAYK